jgi:hypothetical protein
VRRISFSLTERQFCDGSKTVTRRLGWAALKPGGHLLAVRKLRGLKKGERQHVLGEIKIVSVRREVLSRISWVDCAREGFPELSPAEFVAMFCKEMRCKPEKMVRRIEFRRVLREEPPE